MLLSNNVERFTQLCWKSNAPQLPSLLWGKFRRMKYLSGNWKSSISDVQWCILLPCAVSVWYYERHYGFALWTHHTFRMCERDGTALPVSSLENKGSCWLTLIICETLVLLFFSQIGWTFYRYSCPVCSKSYCDMSRVWEKLDQEVNQ